MCRGAVRAMQQAQHIPAFVMAFGLLLGAMSLGSGAVSRDPVLADAEGSSRDHELSRTQATALVQRRYAARVVRASSADEGGRHIYVFRLLSEGGKVWTVRIDARSGAEIP
jgi:uncharacterized membrane protein YkoI